jgi:hypothetical protein
MNAWQGGGDGNVVGISIITLICLPSRALLNRPGIAGGSNS